MRIIPSSSVSSHAALWETLDLKASPPAALSEQQKAGLQEAIADLRQQGDRFLAPRGWLGMTLSGEAYSELDEGQALKTLLAGEKLYCQPSGDTLPARVASLAALASIETLYHGAPPTTALANSLRNLYEAGYRVESEEKPQTRLEAFDSATRTTYVTLKGPAKFSGWYTRPEQYQMADFFHVSHDPKSLERSDFAQALVELQADGWIENAEASYATFLDVNNTCSLSYRGIPVGSFSEPHREAVQAALEKARPACEMAERSVLPMVENRQLAATDAAPLVQTALRPGADPDGLMKLARAAVGRVGNQPGAWASRAYGELLDRKRPQTLEVLVDLVSAVGTEASRCLEFLDDPKRKEGLWALPLPERSQHLRSLARLTDANGARTLLGELGKPMACEEIATRVELMVRLAAAEKLHSSFLSAYSVQRSYQGLADKDSGRALECLKRAQDNALRLGGLEHVGYLTRAELEGWSSEELAPLAERLKTLPGVKPEEEMASLAALASPDLPCRPTCERYLNLLDLLSARQQTAQARVVFPEIKTPRDQADFGTLLEALAREGHVARAAEVFLALKQREPFAEALRAALEGLALGQGPDELLRSTGSASALEQKGNHLRVGGVLLKTKSTG